MVSKLTLLALLAFSLGVVQGRRSKASASEQEVETSENTRQGKYFSLFNVVTFKNYACTSTATGTSGNRKGSCFTRDECSRKGGAANGQCAAGFGVCCTFAVTSGAVSQNCTYIQNTGFPSALSSTGSTVTYTVSKCACNICRLRLDFEKFNIVGPTDTVETGGGTCTDSFTQVTTTQTTYPVICGLNTGEHIYLDMGGACTDTATLTFGIGAATSTTRMWDIKVSQIECGSNYDPGAGCYQYYTETAGQIRTFNFQNAAQTHLRNQNYNICVRRGAGFSCIQYSVCTDANSMSLSAISTTNSNTAADSLCSLDFLTIQGATASCCNNNAAMVSRICGNTLSTTSGVLVKGATNLNVPICDCTPPFNIGIRTDATADANSNTVLSRGLCLNYQQINCP